MGLRAQLTHPKCHPTLVLGRCYTTEKMGGRLKHAQPSVHSKFIGDTSIAGLGHCSHDPCRKSSSLSVKDARNYPRKSLVFHQRRKAQCLILFHMKVRVFTMVRVRFKETRALKSLRSSYIGSKPITTQTHAP